MPIKENSASQSAFLSPSLLSTLPLSHHPSVIQAVIYLLNPYIIRSVFSFSGNPSFCRASMSPPQLFRGMMLTNQVYILWIHRSYSFHSPQLLLHSIMLQRALHLHQTHQNMSPTTDFRLFHLAAAPLPHLVWGWPAAAENDPAGQVEPASRKILIA